MLFSFCGVLLDSWVTMWACFVCRVASLNGFIYKFVIHYSWNQKQPSRCKQIHLPQVSGLRTKKTKLNWFRVFVFSCGNVSVHDCFTGFSPVVQTRCCVEGLHCRVVHQALIPRFILKVWRRRSPAAVWRVPRDAQMLFSLCLNIITSTFQPLRDPTWTWHAVCFYSCAAFKTPGRFVDEFATLKRKYYTESVSDCCASSASSFSDQIHLYRLMRPVSFQSTQLRSSAPHSSLPISLCVSGQVKCKKNCIPDLTGHSFWRPKRGCVCLKPNCPCVTGATSHIKPAN